MNDQFTFEIRFRSQSKADENDPSLGSSLSSICDEIETSEDLDDGLDDHVRGSASLNNMDLDEPDLDDIDYDSQSDPQASEYDEYAEYRWLEAVDGRIHYKNPGDGVLIEIGSVRAFLIRPDRIYEDFRTEMDEVSEETSSLAFSLFDKYGQVKSDFIDHPVKCGSGAWKREVGDGDLLLIELIKVDKEYRRRGLGARIMSDLLEKCRPKSEELIVIAQNAPLNHIIRDEVIDKEDSAEFSLLREEHKDAGKRFWRSLGFRRIGSSQWFGYSFDPAHPSRLLSVTEDWDPPTILSSPESDILHNSLLELVDPTMLAKVQQFFTSTSPDDLKWSRTDSKGDTVLHIAAKQSKPETIKWILAQTDTLLQQRNSDGDTPLEALQSAIEKARTATILPFYAEDISEQYSGLHEEGVQSLAILNGREELNPLEITRIKYGCTCGDCIDGVLSPRTKLALQGEAEMQYDFLMEEAEGNGALWVRDFEEWFRFLRPSVRSNLKTNKSMRIGFANLWKYIASCLKNDIVPTAVNVAAEVRNASEWPPATKNFLERGGTIASVANMLFQLSLRNFVEQAGFFEPDLFEEEIEKLPRCRNDYEFAFVSYFCEFRHVSITRYVSAFTGKPHEPEY